MQSDGSPNQSWPSSSSSESSSRVVVIFAVQNVGSDPDCRSQVFPAGFRCVGLLKRFVRSVKIFSRVGSVGERVSLFLGPTKKFWASARNR
jgi:hypothetical protein